MAGGARPRAALSAAPCALWHHLEQVEDGAYQFQQAGKAQFEFRLDPRRPEDTKPRCCRCRVSQQLGFTDTGFAVEHDATGSAGGGL